MLNNPFAASIVFAMRSDAIPIRRIAICLIACCLTPTWANADPVVSEAQEKIRNVLLLNSFSKGDPWTDKQVDAFEISFSALDNIKLRVAHMDANWKPRPSFEALWSAYRTKYGDIRFDVIITTDEPALRFIARYRDELFPVVPVVFSGITQTTPQMLSEISNITGVKHRYNFAASIGLIFRLQPKTEHVYVIDEGSPDDEPLRKALRTAITPYEKILDLKFITALSLPALKQRLSSLPSHSIVYYISLLNDETGHALNLARVLPEISAAANAPIYSLNDSLLGYGIIGGYVNSAYHQSEEAAYLARKILDGMPANRLPVAEEGKHSLKYMFDFRQLKRFGISVDLLPVESIVKYEPETLYYRIRNYLWLVTGVPILLVLYIGSLLFNIGKRKKAQQGLINIIDQSNRLLQTDSPDEFSLDIRDRLSKIVRVTGEIRLFRYTETGTAFDTRKLLPITQAESARHSNNSRLQPGIEQLIRQAVETRKCVRSSNNLVVIFDHEDIPFNLAHLRTDSWVDEIDFDLVTLLARSITMAIGNLEQYHLLESLQTAHKIQDSMLSKAFREICRPYSIDLDALVLPAKEVGGDLYDFFAIDGDRLCVLVGDVSDKGVPAALFMAMAKTLIRATAETHAEPEQILAKVNNQLCRDNDMSMFVTVFLAIYNRVSEELCFANGGHNPPYIVRRKGTIDTLDMEDGIALGIVPKANFRRHTATLGVGDALFVYSDGITEAMNVNGEMFGEQRLCTALTLLKDEGASGRIQDVLEKTQAFTERAAQSDDITLLCLYRPIPDCDQKSAEDSNRTNHKE